MNLMSLNEAHFKYCLYDCTVSEKIPDLCDILASLAYRPTEGIDGH